MTKPVDIKKDPFYRILEVLKKRRQDEVGLRNSITFKLSDFSGALELMGAVKEDPEKINYLGELLRKLRDDADDDWNPYVRLGEGSREILEEANFKENYEANKEIILAYSKEGIKRYKKDLEAGDEAPPSTSRNTTVRSRSRELEIITHIKPARGKRSNRIAVNEDYQNLIPIILKVGGFWEAVIKFASEEEVYEGKLQKRSAWINYSHRGDGAIYTQTGLQPKKFLESSGEYLSSTIKIESITDETYRSRLRRMAVQ